MRRDGDRWACIHYHLELSNTLDPYLALLPKTGNLLSVRLALVTREDDLGRVDVGTTVAQELLSPFESRALSDVGEVLELDLGLADREERVVLVALLIQILQVG